MHLILLVITTIRTEVSGGQIRQWSIQSQTKLHWRLVFRYGKCFSVFNVHQLNCRKHTRSMTAMVEKSMPLSYGFTLLGWIVREFVRLVSSVPMKTVKVALLRVFRWTRCLKNSVHLVLERIVHERNVSYMLGVYLAYHRWNENLELNKFEFDVNRNSATNDGNTLYI